MLTRLFLAAAFLLFPLHKQDAGPLPPAVMAAQHFDPLKELFPAEMFSHAAGENS